MLILWIWGFRLLLPVDQSRLPLRIQTDRLTTLTLPSTQFCGGSAHVSGCRLHRRIPSVQHPAKPLQAITVIHYAKTTDEKRTEGHVYMRSFLTHKEYNDRRKWDRRFGAK